MTVQDIVDAVSRDTRQVMQACGDDAQIIMGWVDRTHKDVLHSSLYVNQNLNTTLVTTIPGQFTYTMAPPTAIRRIVSVFDTVFNMSLSPSDAELNLPTPTQAHVEEGQGRPHAPAAPSPHQVYKFGGLPEYYRFLAPTSLRLRPAPASASYVSTLNVTYEQLVQTLSNLSADLIVPDDGKDVMVAGTNWLAMAYIGRSQEAASWFQLYQQLKSGERIGVMR